MNKLIEEQLMRLPGLIRDQQNMMLETAARLVDVKRDLELCELDISNGILNTEEGKKQYTNDNARRAAIANIHANNPEYRGKLLAKTDLEHVVQLEKIGLEFLHNTLRATIAIAEMN